MPTRRSALIVSCGTPLAWAFALLMSWMWAPPAGSHTIRERSAVPPPSPRTLVSSRSTIRDFAQDDNSIAWITFGGRLHIRALNSGRTVTIAMPKTHYGPGGLVLAGLRALWHVYIDRSSNRWAEIDMYTASSADTRVRQLPCCEWEHEAGPESWKMAAAGSGAMLVYYSHRDRSSEGEGDELTERVIRRVTGASTTTLFRVDKPPVAALDLNRGRIAIIENDRGEIRLPNGRILVKFKFGGAGQAVALDRSTAAVLKRRTTILSSAKAIALVDVASGRVRAQVPVSREVSSVSAGGGWVVYTEGRSIRGFKARERAVRLHVSAAREPIGLSVAGRRVAWAVNHGARGRIQAFTLPR